MINKRGIGVVDTMFGILILIFIGLILIFIINPFGLLDLVEAIVTAGASLGV